MHINTTSLNKLTLGLAISVSLSSLPTFASEKFFKWTDEDGTTHYSAQPPAKEIAEKQGTEVVRTTGQSIPKDAAAEAERKAKAKEPADPAMCKKARKNLKVLTESDRIRVKEGEAMRYLTKDEVAAKTKLNKQVIEQACAPVGDNADKPKLVYPRDAAIKGKEPKPNKPSAIERPSEL